MCIEKKVFAMALAVLLMVATLAVRGDDDDEQAGLWIVNKNGFDDRLIVPGYSLGEYLSVKSANGSVSVLWGDARNNVTEPVNPLDPLSGQTHSQQNVMFQKVKAQ